jgi:ribosomal protein S18 acetylase RimI-like enzyme
LATIADATGLFPGELLPELMSGFLSSGEGLHLWLTCEADGQAAAFCYAVPEKLTDRTWNMLAIAVHPELQAKGVGGALVKNLEAVLIERGQRILVVDTSGAPEFGRARDFYRKNGYREEARIREFWAAGNDKVVFWKKLNPYPI